MAKPTNQVALNFDKMTPTGLKPLAKKFARYRLNVVEIKATNKPNRQSGFLLKDATFVFESGQSLLVRVKADGTVFQVKLNNKVVPIKHVENMDKAIIELVDHVQDNEKKYLRAKKQRLDRQKVKIDKPTVKVTRKERLEQAEARAAELTAENEDLHQKTSTANSNIEQNKDLLADLEAELKTLKEKGSELEVEVEQLKKEAA